jgi:hypothetical protein
MRSIDAFDELSSILKPIDLLKLRPRSPLGEVLGWITPNVEETEGFKKHSLSKK